jgi:hypothetical protein
LPSMEDVAMYIWLDGVFDTDGCFGLFFAPGGDIARVGDLSEFPWTSTAPRLVASARAVGKGGGKGEIDIDDMLAEWAW